MHQPTSPARERGCRNAEGNSMGNPISQHTTMLLGSMDSTASRNLNCTCWYSRWCSKVKYCTPLLVSTSCMVIPRRYMGDVGSTAASLPAQRQEELFCFLITQKANSHHWVQSQTCFQKQPENFTPFPPLMSQSPKPTQEAQAAFSPHGYFSLSSNTTVKGSTHHLLPPVRGQTNPQMLRHDMTEFSLLGKEVLPSADEQFPFSISQCKACAWQLMKAAPVSVH